MAKRKKAVHGEPFKPELACPVSGVLDGSPAEHRKDAHHYLGRATIEVDELEHAKDCREAVGRALRVAHLIGIVDVSVHQHGVGDSHHKIADAGHKVIARVHAALASKGCVRPKRKKR